MKSKKDTVPARARVVMTPGEMLRTVRLLQGLTQAQLAKASGISQPAISAMETGAAELGVDRARRLARVLCVHPAVLLFPDWEPAAETPSARAASPR
jgi:transcriptional regulator with XRE-family HTH domain